MIITMYTSAGGQPPIFGTTIAPRRGSAASFERADFVGEPASEEKPEPIAPVASRMPVLLVVTRRIQVKVPVVVPQPAQISRSFGRLNRRGELLSTAGFGVRLGPG